MKIEEKIWEDSYNDTLIMLERKSKMESFDIEYIKQQLCSLYEYHGQDWGGRGELKNAEIDGEITAYQVFIHNYEKDKAD